MKNEISKIELARLILLRISERISFLEIHAPAVLNDLLEHGNEYDIVSWLTEEDENIYGQNYGQD